MPDRPRYLKRGVVPIAAGVTAVLAALRLFHALGTTWPIVGIPALFVACAYLQIRVEAWAANRRQR